MRMRMHAQWWPNSNLVYERQRCLRRIETSVTNAKSLMWNVQSYRRITKYQGLNFTGRGELDWYYGSTASIRLAYSKKIWILMMNLDNSHPFQSFGHESLFIVIYPAICTGFWCKGILSSHGKSEYNLITFALQFRYRLRNGRGNTFMSWGVAIHHAMINLHFIEFKTFLLFFQIVDISVSKIYEHLKNVVK